MIRNLIAFLVPNLNHHYQAYGEWSFALEDYENMGIMGYLNTPQFLAMGAVVDPYSYLSRLTMPLYIICATGISLSISYANSN